MRSWLKRKQRQVQVFTATVSYQNLSCHITPGSRCEPGFSQTHAVLPSQKDKKKKHTKFPNADISVKFNH